MQYFSYKDVAGFANIQARFLSKISASVNNKLPINNEIETLYKQFYQCNKKITQEFLNKSIFNTTTIISLLYFYVTWAKEKNELSKFGLDKYKLSNFTNINKNMTMLEFSQVLRNALSHPNNLKFFINGDIEIINSELCKEKTYKLTQPNLNKILKNENYKNIIIEKNDANNYEIVCKNYYTTFKHKFTFEEFKNIAELYNKLFEINFLSKN